MAVMSICEVWADASKGTSHLCLVLGVALHWPQLMEAVGKLALAPIAALPGSRPCPAQLGLQQAKHLEAWSLYPPSISMIRSAGTTW